MARYGDILDNACHHHCYELAPTAAELRRLHVEVSALLAELDVIRAGTADRALLDR